MPPSDPVQSRWFSQEILPHEPALRAYLRSRFPQLGDCDDVLQETYIRVLREQEAGRLRQARAFLFTAARNVAIDFFRRERSNPRITVPHSLTEDVVEEAPGAAEVLSSQQELESLAEAVRILPDRCRHVIMLRYLKGCSYKEIADILGVSTETVKTHMAKGVRRCAEFFAARGLLEERRTRHDTR